MCIELVGVFYYSQLLYKLCSTSENTLSESLIRTLIVSVVTDQCARHCLKNSTAAAVKPHHTTTHMPAKAHNAACIAMCQCANVYVIISATQTEVVGKRTAENIHITNIVSMRGGDISMKEVFAVYNCV